MRIYYGRNWESSESPRLATPESLSDAQIGSTPLALVGHVVVECMLLLLLLLLLLFLYIFLPVLPLVLLFKLLKLLLLLLLQLLQLFAWDFF